MRFKAMLICAAIVGMQGGTLLHADGQKFRETVTVKGTARGAFGEHVLTFSTPVALPGVSLGAGTYIFRYAEHNALQVMSSGRTPYAMFLTIPTTRHSPTWDYSIVLGEPLGPGSPKRIVALFAPGEMAGREFVYPGR
jgi:hypothetical protein